MALDGDTVIIGAPEDDVGGNVIRAPPTSSC